MNTLRQRVFRNWHVMRIVRLVLGFWLLVMAIQTQDMAVGFFSTFFVFTAVFGIGCCGVNGCYTQPPKHRQRDANDVDYEEIK